jgi:TadE-like protein
MQKRSDAQSIVEMALLLPTLILILFGIIDLSYYIYGYATMYQAARNGAEKAAELPPFPRFVGPLRTTPDASELCVSNILSETLRVANRFPDLETGPGNSININYPARDSNNQPLRALGAPIEISIVYNIRPLTPLWRFVTFGTQGTMRVRTTARRSLEALGDNPTALNLVACQP